MHISLEQKARKRGWGGNDGVCWILEVELAGIGWLGMRVSGVG